MIWNRCLLHRGAKTASKRNASATRRGTAKAVGNCSIALPVEEFILGNHLGLWTWMCHQAAYRITDFGSQAASFAACVSESSVFDQCVNLAVSAPEIRPQDAQ